MGKRTLEFYLFVQPLSRKWPKINALSFVLISCARLRREEKGTIKRTRSKKNHSMAENERAHVYACMCVSAAQWCSGRAFFSNDDDTNDDDFVEGKTKKTRKREREWDRGRAEVAGKVEGRWKREEECDDGKVNLCPVAPSRNSILYSGGSAGRCMRRAMTTTGA